MVVSKVNYAVDFLAFNFMFGLSQQALYQQRTRVVPQFKDCKNKDKMPPCMPAKVIYILFQSFSSARLGFSSFAEVGSRWGHAKHLCLFIRIIYLFLCSYRCNIYISQDTGGSGGSQSTHNSKTIKRGADSSLWLPFDKVTGAKR